VRSLTIATAFVSLTIVTSCASRSHSGAAPVAPVRLLWDGGSVSPARAVTIDLRSCTMTLDRVDRMTRSGALDADACASLARAARALPRTVAPGNCPVPKPLLPSFGVTYDDGTSIGGPRCAADDAQGARDRELITALARVIEERAPALAASGATPPGECDPIECRPDASSSTYEFSSDGSFSRCPDGRSVRETKERCVRDAAGGCVLREIEIRSCPR
jgi:hypothetical protein